MRRYSTRIPAVIVEAYMRDGVPDEYMREYDYPTLPVGRASILNERALSEPMTAEFEVCS